MSVPADRCFTLSEFHFPNSVVFCHIQMHLFELVPARVFVSPRDRILRKSDPFQNLANICAISVVYAGFIGQIQFYSHFI